MLLFSTCLERSSDLYRLIAKCGCGCNGEGGNSTAIPNTVRIYFYSQTYFDVKEKKEESKEESDMEEDRAI
jgi:hypothetical protein